MPQHRQAPAISRAPQIERGASLPRQQRGARQDREGPEQQPPVDVLAKRQPGDAHGRQAFEVEQQRGAGRVGAGEAEHQQQRPADAPEQDHEAEPRQVGTTQRGFDGGKPQRGPRQVDGRETAAGP